MDLSIYNSLNWPVIILLALVDLILKGIGLWHAARNNQRNWFIALMFLNTFGILPLFYLRYFQKKNSAKSTPH